jgi:hypothetical protein
MRSQDAATTQLQRALPLRIVLAAGGDVPLRVERGQMTAPHS